MSRERRSLLLIAVLLLTVFSSRAEERPPDPPPPPTQTPQQDPVAGFLERQRGLTPGQTPGFTQELSAFLRSEAGPAAVDRLAEEVANFRPPLDAKQEEKLALLTKMLDLQASDRDHRFQGGAAGAILPRPGTTAPGTGTPPPDWQAHLGAAGHAPSPAAAALLGRGGARNVGPEANIPVSGFAHAPPPPAGANGQLPQLYTPPAPPGPFALGPRLPAALSAEFNPARDLPARGPQESFAAYLDRLPLGTLQAYQHHNQGRLDALAAQGRGPVSRSDGVPLILRREEARRQEQALSRWTDGHIAQALERRQQSVMPLVAHVESGQAFSAGQLAGLNRAQLGDLFHVLQRREEARAPDEPLRLRLPSDGTTNRTDQARAAVWRELLDRGADPASVRRFGAPSSWMGLSDEELRTRLAAGADPAALWRMMREGQDRLGGLGPEGSRAARQQFFGLQEQLNRVVARATAPGVQRLEEGGAAGIRAAYDRLGTGDFAAAMADLARLRGQAMDRLRSDPASGLPAAEEQRRQLDALVGRIDAAQAFLRRLPAAANSSYVQGDTLPGLHTVIGPDGRITGGTIYKVSDNSAGALGVNHQHLMLEVTYRDAQGREQRAAWPFGFFHTAATERDNWLNAAPSVSGENLRNLSPNQVFTAYSSLLDGQARMNHLFQTGQVSWSLLGEGNHLGGWTYTGLPWLAAQVNGGVNRLAGGGPTVNCRDVACILADHVDGSLSRI